MKTNETTAMGAGSVEGATKPFLGKPIKRDSLIEEFLLEKTINESIDTFLLESFAKFKKKKLNEVHLSNFIRKTILSEAKEVEKDPHIATGINVLEDLLKKIVPTLEEDYKSLTTNAEQRKSYMAHILRATQQTLDTLNLNQQAGEMIDVQEGMIQDDISVKVNEPEKDEKFIDIDGKKGQGEEEVDTFSITGEDETGRNMARATFDQIEKQIIDSYSILSDPEDKQLFYQYLIANLRLYMMKFEDELSNVVSEPETGSDIEQDQPQL